MIESQQFGCIVPFPGKFDTPSKIHMSEMQKFQTGVIGCQKCKKSKLELLDVRNAKNPNWSHWMSEMQKNPDWSYWMSEMQKIQTGVIGCQKCKKSRLELLDGIEQST
jgi:hypothetical protein